MTAKLRILLVTVMGIAACLSLFPAARAGKGETETSVSLDQLPAAVRATVDREAATGSVHEIERTTAGGVDVYCVDIVRGGKTLDIDVATDGRIISTKMDARIAGRQPTANGCPGNAVATKVRLSQLSAPARATLKREAGKGTIGNIEEATINGVKVYCADIMSSGRTTDVDVAADGKLIPPPRGAGTTRHQSSACDGEPKVRATNPISAHGQGTCALREETPCPDDCQYREPGCPDEQRHRKSACPDDCERRHPGCADDCRQPHSECEDDD